MSRLTRLAISTGLVAAVAVAGLVAPDRAAKKDGPASTSLSSARRAKARPTVGMSQPLVPAQRALPKAASSPSADPILFTCQEAGAPEICYSPSQLRTAYEVQPLINRGVTGRGTTIVIVIAYSPPTLVDDLHVFDQAWGLPDPSIKIIAPYGAKWDPSNDEQVGWAGEADLDTQWAHAIAPAANLVVVEAKSSADADLIAAAQYAVDHRLGQVISQSFGDAENCLPASLLAHQHAVFERAAREHITVLAAAGDNGSAQPTCDYTSFAESSLSPAADPGVLAVGGTQLQLDLSTGAYLSETVWNESLTQHAAGGGGFSDRFRKPFYQIGAVSGRSRGLPDVSYDASVNDGVLIYYGALGSWWIAGGTSAGTPQWAALVALADQAGHRSLGYVNPELYLIGHTRLRDVAFHDITTGDNTYTYSNSDGSEISIAGYSATKGWDAASGWGSPHGYALVELLAHGLRP